MAIAASPEASSPADPGRGSLWAIILARTGEDVRQCVHCWRCEAEQRPEVDLSFSEVLQAAARDSRRALENQTIWLHGNAQPGEVQCHSGLDVGSILQVLQQEARLRGLAPSASHPSD